ncbi:MAG TPA: AAA family ATPase [Candidatus Tectomicrobia bacterium]
MYKEFYGFTTYPFSITPDPQFLYLSKKHETCLHDLLYSLKRGHGFIALTGQTGTGKTLLLKVLEQSLDERTHVALLVNSALDSCDILRHTCHELKLDITGKSKIELLSNLENILLTSEKINEKFVIIIDEAQNLSVDVLENLRLLSNFENSGKKVLQIILAGDQQLEERLQSEELAKLRQCLDRHCFLLPMEDYETQSYIERRLLVAGVTRPVFTSRAMKNIFLHSKGIPRLINLICDNALLCGFGHEKRKLGHDIIQQVVQDLHLDVIEQVETSQSRQDFRRAKRLALLTGLVSLSLLGAGFVLRTSLTDGKLKEERARAVTSPATVPPQHAGVRELPLLPQSPRVRDLPLLPQSSGGRDLPLLPQSSGGRDALKRVQWVQPTLSYQLPTGTPLTVPLPQLQRMPQDLAATVTLDISESTPGWLTFDPDKLVLSGTAPLQDIGKTYYLTFRAQTADGLESLLQLILTLRGQTRP